MDDLGCSHYFLPFLKALKLQTREMWYCLEPLGVHWWQLLQFAKHFVQCFIARTTNLDMILNLSKFQVNRFPVISMRGFVVCIQYHLFISRMSYKDDLTLEKKGKWNKFDSLYSLEQHLNGVELNAPIVPCITGTRLLPFSRDNASRCEASQCYDRPWVAETPLDRLGSCRILPSWKGV